MAEIFGYPIMGGGGSSGGTLTVTGVAGSTVTVSNADKSYTRTLDSTGKAIFKGLASGTWTVTMTDGTRTATRTVTVEADREVSIEYELVLFGDGAFKVDSFSKSGASQWQQKISNQELIYSINTTVNIQDFTSIFASGAIDLSQYNRLCAQVSSGYISKQLTTNQGDCATFFNIQARSGSNTLSSATLADSKTFGGAAGTVAEKTASCDVSKITGNTTIAVVCTTYQWKGSININANVHITKIWLA